MTATVTPEYSTAPAEVYDRHFVPALFGPWAETVCDLAEIGSGHDVLDVACGTGVCALAAAERVGGDGRVVGLDANPEMLAVARRKDAAVEWRDGRAEELPFASAAFDRIVSQFGFMFFEDPVESLREMARVLRPTGRLVVAVCDGLDHSPGYAVLTELLHRLFGADVAEAFRAPFTLGDRNRLRSITRRAGLDWVDVTREEGTVRFASIEALVSTERACAWTLGGLLDEEQFSRLLVEAEESLQPFVVEDGSVAFEMPALCVLGEKPAVE